MLCVSKHVEALISAGWDACTLYSGAARPLPWARGAWGAAASLGHSVCGGRSQHCPVVPETEESGDQTNTTPQSVLPAHLLQDGVLARHGPAPFRVAGALRSLATPFPGEMCPHTEPGWTQPSLCLPSLPLTMPGACVCPEGLHRRPCFYLK